ncbi:MAG TPA: hypothetical protein DEQ27_07475 [Prevotella sp.]|nr:hypothetical protein [Prevotella sp.]
MKKKEYIKPVTTIIGMQAYGSMLAGSFDNVADSKENSFDSDLWDTAESSPNTNWAGYRNYNQTGANERFEEE